MKIALTLCLLINFSAHAQMGKTPLGPDTLGQPTAPSSGQLPKRTNDMTGEDMSNATFMSSDVDPRVPSRNPGAQKQESENETQTGPYKDGVYQFWNKDASRR